MFANARLPVNRLVNVIWGKTNVQHFVIVEAIVLEIQNFSHQRFVHILGLLYLSHSNFYNLTGQRTQKYYSHQ
jgi:hypothetical protein